MGPSGADCTRKENFVKRGALPEGGGDDFRPKIHAATTPSRKFSVSSSMKWTRRTVHGMYGLGTKSRTLSLLSE